MSRADNADARFHEAFIRLKEGRPTVLVAGAAVSQNNVAREAGKHPSALRKDRYPDLIKEIQDHCVKSPKDERKAEYSVMADEVSKLRETIALLKKKQELEASKVLSLLLEVSHLRKQLSAAKNCGSSSAVVRI